MTIVNLRCRRAPRNPFSGAWEMERNVVFLPSLNTCQDPMCEWADWGEQARHGPCLQETYSLLEETGSIDTHPNNYVALGVRENFPDKEKVNLGPLEWVKVRKAKKDINPRISPGWAPDWVGGLICLKNYKKIPGLSFEEKVLKSSANVYSRTRKKTWRVFSSWRREHLSHFTTIMMAMVAQPVFLHPTPQSHMTQPRKHDNSLWNKLSNQVMCSWNFLEHTLNLAYGQ
jgi:hypothetical protein